MAAASASGVSRQPRRLGPKHFLADLAEPLGDMPIQHRVLLPMLLGPQLLTPEADDGASKVGGGISHKSPP